MKKIILAAVFAVATLISSAAYAQEKGTAEEAKQMVLDAIAYINEHGKEKAFAEFQNPDGQFRKKDLYIFVNEHRGKMVAHGANPALVGKNTYDIKDADGKLFFHEFGDVVQANPEGGWVDYKWPNPTTKKIEQKSSFVKDLDGELLVGCGIYK